MRLVDLIGSTLVASAAAAPLSCLPTEGRNLQPFVAVAGAYALMDSEPAPSPAPASGCVDGCRCNGTGREKSGDGITVVECRCPAGCECKQTNAPQQSSKSSTVTRQAPCATGNCPLPTRIIVR